MGALIQLQFNELIAKEPVRVDMGIFKGVTDLNVIRPMAYEIYNQTKTAQFPDGTEVHFVKKGFSEIRSHSANLDVMRMVTALPNLVRNAIFLYSEPERNPIRYPNRICWLSYAGHLEIGDKRFYVLISTWMKRDRDKDYLSFYDANLTLAEFIEKGSGIVPSLLKKEGVS